MSSHDFDYLPPDECLAHAKALESCGPDFVKIPMAVHGETGMIEAWAPRETIAAD